MKFKICYIFVYFVLQGIFFAKDVNSLEIDGYISQQKIYNGNFFFLNKKNKCVYKYSKKYKLLNTFGKYGEGPGELTEIYGFDFVKDKVYLQSMNKILFFNKDGKLIKGEKKPRPSYFIVLNNGNMIERFTEYNSDNKPGLTVDKVYLCDTDFNRVKLLIVDSEMKKPGMLFEDFINKLEVKYCANKGVIVISQRNKGFLFHLFNENGDELFKIKRINMEKLKVSEKFKNDFKEKLLSDPRMRSNLEMANQLMKRIKFSKYFPPFHSYYIDENGNIFIRSYNRKNSRLLYKKYSSQGKFINDIWLEDKNPDIFETRKFISFFNDRFFYLKENEDGEYIIIKQRLNEKIQ